MGWRDLHKEQDNDAQDDDVEPRDLTLSGLGLGGLQAINYSFSLGKTDNHGDKANGGYGERREHRLWSIDVDLLDEGVRKGDAMGWMLVWFTSL